MATRGRRTKRARGRGSSNPPKPSTSLGVKIDKNRIQKKGPVKGFDALNNKQKSAPFNFEQNEDNNYNDSEDEEMQLLEQAADETDRRKVISLEGISSSSGRRITRSHGKGCSDPPGASPLCIDPPPQPGHTRVSPGVKSDKNRIQKKRRGEELQLIVDKICQSQLHKQQVTNAINTEKYIGSNFGLSNNARSSSVGYHVEGISNPGRGVRRGRGRGRCIAPGPSQSYIDPPTPAHTLVSPVVKNDNNRVGRKGLVKHGRGRGRSDPPEPLSCIVPPPPAAHTSVSPVRAKQKRLKNTLKSAQQTQCATNPQAPAQVHTSPQAPHVPSEIHTSPQTPTSAHSLPQTHHVGHSPTQAPTYSSPLVEGSSYATLNDTTPVNSSSTYEIPQQSHTSRQCVGRESADCWTVEAIDPQGAIKRIKLKYWQVNDLPIGEHVIVHFNDQGAAYGEAQGLLAGYCGTLATNPNLFPINYERWLGKLGMPKSYLDNCFEKNIEPRFQFRTTEALAKRYCKLSIAKKWAAHRQNLWTRFYDPSKTRDQITSNIPLGVDPIQWAHFVDYRLKPETLERCRKNKENRSKQLIPHTGGSKPLSRKRHEMFLQTGEQPCRGKLFIETHKKKDGSFVNDAAKDIVEQIEVGLTQSSVHESEISPNDVLGKVLGPEHPGRVRCMGMGAAPTNTFKNNGVRLSILGNSSTAAATSSSNFWQEKYTHLESQVQNTMEAFKAYIIMKEGRIPDQVASIFGSSNEVGLDLGPKPRVWRMYHRKKGKGIANANDVWLSMARNARN
ncbi:uncharacterized protein LOC123906808 isoform X3 [Trifolium pratense]|uniref:uncharacterized protein LOC123906808 isoform X3 n=1 Tax=Trifolium pratense TaxID=57577 RepID=UPI001E6938B8|nr:uncharacterized protein LOC123906808 isoform X3 [Trifolium pratense]